VIFFWIKSALIVIRLAWIPWGPSEALWGLTNPPSFRGLGDTGVKIVDNKDLVEIIDLSSILVVVVVLLPDSNSFLVFRVKAICGKISVIAK